MIGGDDHAVVRGQVGRGEIDRSHVGVVVVAHFVELGEVGVVVLDGCAATDKELHDLEGGGFAQVVPVFLVSNAQHQYPRALQGFLAVIQGTGDRVDNMIGHGGVDLASE